MLCFVIIQNVMATGFYFTLILNIINTFYKKEFFSYVRKDERDYC